MAESLGVVRTVPIALRGELYKIAPTIKWPQARARGRGGLFAALLLCGALDGCRQAARPRGR